MKKLKRDVMNEVANFEIEVALPYAMNKTQYRKYKVKYNQALERHTNKILVLFWNAVGELI